MSLAGANPGTFHVARDGDDANGGSSESPYRTLQRAADVARAGDTVVVRGGVYRGHVFLRFSGEPDKPIVFRNAPGERPILDGEGKGRLELQSEHGWRQPVGWIVVEGFAVRNGWDGIHDNIFYRNAVKLGTGDCQGIGFVAPGGGHLIRNNLFFGPGRTAIGGEPRHYTLAENVEDLDPQLVDTDHFDFRLRPGSPAMDATGKQRVGASRSTDAWGAP